MTDSGYPKKDEIIHASDVGRTFVKTDVSNFPAGPWTMYTADLVRRNDEVAEALIYVAGSLDSSTPGSAFMTIGTAKSSLQNLANEHHTHTTSDFTELGAWRIRTDVSNTRDLIFGDLYHDKWYLAPDSKFGSTYIYSICYGNGKFVAVGNLGKIAYSTDAINWTAVTNSKFDSSIRSICYGNGKYVAVGNNGKITYSPDAISWTLITDSKFDSTHIYGICYGNEKYVAVGGGGRISYAI